LLEAGSSTGGSWVGVMGVICPSKCQILANIAFNARKHLKSLGCSNYKEA